MRVALYARYSTEKQNDGYSIETQLEACHKRLDAEGEPYEVTEYIDRAKSGTTIAGRTALMRLIGDAANGLLDRVMVYKFDRLGRSQAETATLIQDLEDAGVEVVSATEGDDPLARGMHLVFAEHYRRQLAERTHAGNVKAAKAGHIGCPAPYGYARDDEGQFTVDPEQAAMAQRIFRDYRQGGSMKSIARALNREGIPSPAGGEWHAPSVLSMFDNEIYIGRLIFNQREFYRNRKTGRRIYRERPEDEWIVMDRPDLAIIDQETWDAVQGRRAKRRCSSGKGRRTYALSGLVRCADCGHIFVAQPSKNSKGHYIYMTCGARQTGGTCKNSFRFRMDLVRDEMIRQVCEDIFSPEAIDRMRKTITRLAAERLATKDADLEHLEEQKAACQKKISAVMQLMVEAKERGDETDDLWADELGKLKANLAALEEREKELNIGPRLDLSRLTRAIQKTICRQKDGLLGAREPEMVRDGLRLFVGEVEAYPDGRLEYKTNPVDLLEADGESREALVAGAGFEPATFRL